LLCDFKTQNAREENEMRREQLLSVSVALLAGLLGGALSARFLSASPAAADTTPSITAQTFYLVDEKGTRLADIAGAGGGATMTLYDHGGAAMTLHSTGGVSGLSLFDHHATQRAAFEVDHDGTAALKFYSGDGKLIRQLP
jgi:hypothetical protein